MNFTQEKWYQPNIINPRYREGCTIPEGRTIPYRYTLGVASLLTMKVVTITWFIK